MQSTSVPTSNNAPKAKTHTGIGLQGIYNQDSDCGFKEKRALKDGGNTISKSVVFYAAGSWVAE